MPVVVRSQNGYSANDRSIIRSFTIPGTTTKVALRIGDTSVVLLDFLAWFDKNIQSIDGGALDDWGFAERNIRGSSTTLSNHASGTAVDVNAVLHALGHRGTFTPQQAAKIRAKLKEYAGVIRWGGDYKGRVDEMHFEINKGIAAVRVQANRIRAKAAAPAKTTVKKPIVISRPGPTPVPMKAVGRGDMPVGTNPLLRKGDKGPRVEELQHGLRIFDRSLVIDGDFGPTTDKVLRAYQAKKGIKIGIGEVTQPTWAKIRADINAWTASHAA